MEVKASELSTGYRQNLRCAMAMFSLPELLILESPTDGLDHYSIHLLKRVVKVMMERGVSVIVVSVRPTQFIYSASQVVWLGKERVHLQGRPRALIDEMGEQVGFLRVTPAMWEAK